MAQPYLLECQTQQQEKFLQKHCSMCILPYSLGERGALSAVCRAYTAELKLGDESVFQGAKQVCCSTGNMRIGEENRMTNR